MRRPGFRFRSRALLGSVLFLALLGAAAWAQFWGAQATATRAQRAWQASRATAARAWLGLLWQQRPADPARAEAYARALAQAGQWATVQRVLTTARAAGAPLSPTGFRLLAQAYTRQGEPAAALEVWRAAVRVHPHEPGLWRDYAAALDAAHRWPEAGRAWQRAARLAPEDLESAYQAALHMAAVSPQAGRAALAPLAAGGPYASQAARVLQAVDAGLAGGHETYARVQTGRGLAAVGRWDLATWAWALAVRQMPDYAPAWAYLGEGYRRLGWDKAALGALRTARALAPQDPLPALLWAAYAQQHGQPFTALAWARRAWAAAPDDPALAAHLAVALTRALPGQIGPALAVLHYPPRAHPQDPDAWLTLARLALQWDLVAEQALPALRHVLALNPEHPQALALMGHAYARLGDATTAEQFLIRALQHDPGLAEAHLYLAWVYLATDRAPAAQEHLLWAMRLAPHDDPIAALARRTWQRVAP